MLVGTVTILIALVVLRIWGFQHLYINKSRLRRIRPMRIAATYRSSTLTIFMATTETTVVQTVDTYVNIGCHQNSSDVRVLEGNSLSAIASRERYIESVAANGWKYLKCKDQQGFQV
jgi:hypothetical protein